MKRITTALLVILLLAVTAAAQDAAIIPSEVTLFKNVNIFDGTTAELKRDYDVLVVQNMIKKIAQDIPTSGSYEIDATGSGVKTTNVRIGGLDGYTITTVSEDGKAAKKQVKVNVIDGKGMTLMPGMIDSHVHLNMMVPVSGPSALEGVSWEEIGSYAVVNAQEWLQRGFTTVRDMGGMHEGMRKVIDRGRIAGPRIYCAGGIIGQTSGHGDWRLASQYNAKEASLVRLGLTRIADGRPEMLKACRENFASGADYLKIMVGGGVSSEKDPLHSSQLTRDEIRAAVEAAEAWDTYVAMHVYFDRDIRRAMEEGVMCIDHGQFIEKETLEEAKRRGVVLSINVSGMDPIALDHPVYGNPTGPQYPKFLKFMKNSENLFKRVKEVDPIVVFNTDFIFLDVPGVRTGLDHEMGYLEKGVGTWTALKALTSNGGKLAELTGQNNPYPDGKLGVIEEGAYADILIVDGNPLESLACLGASLEWFDAKPRGPSIETIKLIMKDGQIYKNTIDQ